MKISKRTGNKYLTVGECEILKSKIEALVKQMGLNVYVGYHPRYLEVPIYQEPKEAKK